MLISGSPTVPKVNLDRLFVNGHFTNHFQLLSHENVSAGDEGSQ